ncbi:hypothetical protein E4P41_11945 [Geodermatophilus sp. DF01-2]|uniref:hypothetical protein n=1 Tax=Geodermatophilus sp. DF01-2 TaxID=2559610 RepID=UPI00107301D9|nr:hypothetical protein [Geodermatophilus sp. DF01_2]TFV59279.1 hypothetical protein E4P41_11945 [Geodermatophilus sp. DF01_2]
MMYRAAAALPYPDRARATAGLCGQLRLLARAGGGELDWTTLTVDGPIEVPVPGGATWFEWQVTIEAIGGRDLTREPVDDLPAVDPTARHATASAATRPQPAVE